MQRHGNGVRAAERPLHSPHEHRKHPAAAGRRRSARGWRRTAGSGSVAQISLGWRPAAFVLGSTAAVAPHGVAVAPAISTFDLPVMVAVALACLPIFARGHVIARWEGAPFLFYFAAYFTCLALASAKHDALPRFSGAMLFFVIPLTVATFATVVIRRARPKRLESAEP